jgi:hypothetical protein
LIVPCPAAKEVSVRLAGKDVITRAAPEPVPARAAVHPVVAASAEHAVYAVRADQLIGRPAAIKSVMTRAADQAGLTPSRPEKIIAAAAVHRGGPEHLGADCDAVRAAAAADGDLPNLRGGEPAHFCPVIAHHELVARRIEGQVNPVPACAAGDEQCPPC